MRTMFLFSSTSEYSGELFDWEVEWNLLKVHSRIKKRLVQRLWLFWRNLCPKTWKHYLSPMYEKDILVDPMRDIVEMSTINKSYNWIWKHCIQIGTFFEIWKWQNGFYSHMERELPGKRKFTWDLWKVRGYLGFKDFGETDFNLLFRKLYICRNIGKKDKRKLGIIYVTISEFSRAKLLIEIHYCSQCIFYTDGAVPGE